MLDPIQLIWWALAAIVAVFAFFIIVAIIMSIITMIRKAFAKPTEKSDATIIGGGK